MVDMVRNAFKRNLKRLDWMDEETRVAAMQKADAITKMIGYPDYILVATELDKKYEDLKFKEDEYFNNNVELSRFNLRANLKKLDEPVNKTRWSMTPPTVNAFYTPTKNQIAIPYGILQPPFYDTRTQNALNYGAMGVIMGHELTHAFDDQGREYDATGNLHNWWNNQTIDRFKNRTTCLVNQYSAFNVNKKAVNGNLTLGENIADNGGLKAAFHAYETWAVQNPGEQSLPGLNLSQKQLFFVAFAQVWCSASTQEAAKLQLEKDPHAPSKHRVLGPLSNMDEFSKVWQCKPGSAMNPVNKCEVW
ncbi:endothelin-converting enzyme homolog [Frankliniella occidentalis]|nr:endothelin-converting enzyme homolog [Frankliniella occidentalis]